MIIRRRHTANFTTIGNKLFEDERLAADELGILAYLRSKPHDWEVRRPVLMKRFRIGRDALKRIVANWMRCGWCGAQKTKRADGTFCIIYEIRDEPGPELSDDEIRRALSPESGEVASDQVIRNSEPCINASLQDELCGQPPTCQPALGEPALADPHLAYISKQNKELTKKDSTNQIERESETDRAKHAANLVEFKKRYPTVPSDDQIRLDNAWFALTLAEGEAAIARIPDFLAKQKKDGRTKLPASFTYLAQKRWTLLDAAAADEAKTAPSGIPSNSIEAQAIRSLYAVARKSPVEIKNRLFYQAEVTTQLRAFAKAGSPSSWPFVELGKAIASWSEFLDKHVFGVRTHFVVTNGGRRGIFVPWLFPPTVDGKTYPITGPPPDQDSTDLMTEDDYENFDR
jgi:hypothetical protein